MDRYQRPKIPYNPPIVLQNNNRYELITDQGLPINPDIMDGEANYLIYALNDLYLVTQSVAAGVLFGANNPNNKFKFPITDGANQISWIKVTESYYANESISTQKLKTSCVDSRVLAGVSVGNEHIQDGAIRDNNIDDNEISFSKIKDENSTAFQQFFNNQEDGSLDGAKLGDGSVPGSALPINGVDGSVIEEDSLPASKITGNSITKNELSPLVQFHVGMMMPWTVPGDAPPGWIFADGVARLISAYPVLAAAYGNTYPGGDGVTTFGIPDTRGRTIHGFFAGNPQPTGGRITSGTLAIGGAGGAETHTLTIGQIPAHTHIYEKSITGNLIANGGGDRTYPAGPGVDTGPAGNGESHNNMSPYMLMPMIIYAGV